MAPANFKIIVDSDKLKFASPDEINSRTEKGGKLINALKYLMLHKYPIIPLDIRESFFKSFSLENGQDKHKFVESTFETLEAIYKSKYLPNRYETKHLSPESKDMLQKLTDFFARIINSCKPEGKHLMITSLLHDSEADLCLNPFLLEKESSEGFRDLLEIIWGDFFTSKEYSEFSESNDGCENFSETFNSQPFKDTAKHKCYELVADYMQNNYTATYHYPIPETTDPAEEMALPDTSAHIDDEL